MAWGVRAGNGSAIRTLDASHAPKLKRTDKIVPLLEQGVKAHESGQLERALTAYQQVMGLDAENVHAMVAASMVHHEKGEQDAAEWLLRRAIQVAPTCLAYNTLGMVLLGRRQYDAAVNAYRSSISLDPTNFTTWPNLLFTLDMHPFATNALRLAERRRFNEVYCRELTEAAPPHENDPDPERRLRVGYVSADFKQHSAANGFGPVLFGHDKAAFDVHLYDVDQSPPNADDRVAGYFQTLPGATWHDVRGYDDATLAATIRADEVDILVDLSGYSAGGRPLMFARKPAPIQVSGLGYATGLGIDAMDYLLTDEYVLPDVHARWYHEKPLRLPCFMGFEQSPPWPEVGPPPRARNGYTTYGYLGRAIKISPQSLAAWAEILGRQPTARLILKCGEYHDQTLVGQIRGALSALGVEPDRVEFRLGTSRYDHLAAYHDIDISLDPFPHNGGVTTIESFLMGVPTITLLGDYVSGRVGASFLNVLGFRQAIARTPAEYVTNAAEMADTVWTVEDRQALRRRVTISVLLNERAYAGAVENAYREVWKEWCQGRSRAEVAPL